MKNLLSFLPVFCLACCLLGCEKRTATEEVVTEATEEAVAEPEPTDDAATEKEVKKEG